MFHEIVMISERKLVGHKRAMCFSKDQTQLLWRGFAPVRNKIEPLDDNLFSAAIYPEGFFGRFNPDTIFEKWAAVEVKSFERIADGFERLTIPAGKYAVFHYKGSSANAAAVFRYILGTWLPASGYQLDDRPHFEILGQKYKNAHDESEEDIYIPVRRP